MYNWYYACVIINTSHNVFITCCYRENYLFSCQCPLCLSQADDPDVTSEEEGAVDDDDESVDDTETNMWDDS